MEHLYCRRCRCRLLQLYYALSPVAEAAVASGQHELADGAPPPVQRARVQRAPGTAVEGLDLTALTPEHVAEIKQLLWLHGVLVFRNQPLSYEQQSSLTDWFGPQPGPSAFAAPHTRNAEFPALLLISNKPVANPDTLPSGERSKTEGATDFGLVWHSDYYYTLPSGHVTVLQAVEPPAVGGETLFADCFAAYGALTAAQRDKYGVSAVHSIRQMYKRLPQGDLGGYGRLLTAEELARFDDVRKPLVRAHPHTGQLALFPGQANSVFPDGVPVDEARCAHAIKSKSSVTVQY